MSCFLLYARMTSIASFQHTPHLSSKGTVGGGNASQIRAYIPNRTTLYCCTDPYHSVKMSHKTLAAHSLGPARCEVGPSWIGFVIPKHPIDAQSLNSLACTRDVRGLQQSLARWCMSNSHPHECQCPRFPRRSEHFICGLSSAAVSSPGK